MKKSLFVLLAATGIAAAPIAHAAETSLGWYAGGNLGIARTTLDRNPSEGFLEDDGTDLTWALRGGYRFHKNWAVEAGYADLGRSHYHFPDELQQSIKLQVLHLTAVGIFPFTERIAGFAKLGVAQVRGDDGFDKSSDVTPHVGLGLSYDLTKAVVLRADYDFYGRAQHGQDDISAETLTQALSLGFDFHF